MSDAADVVDSLTTSRAADGKVTVTATRRGGGLSARWAVKTFASCIDEGILEARDGLDRAWKVMKEWAE